LADGGDRGGLAPPPRILGGAGPAGGPEDRQRGDGPREDRSPECWHVLAPVFEWAGPLKAERTRGVALPRRSTPVLKPRRRPESRTRDAASAGERGASAPCF